MSIESDSDYYEDESTEVEIERDDYFRVPMSRPEIRAYYRNLQEKRFL